MLRAHWVTFGVTVVPPEAIGAVTHYVASPLGNFRSE